MAFGPEHRAALRIETIVSAAINSLIPAGIIWVIDARPPEALFGANGIVGPMLAAAGLATLMMTLVLTTIIRVRVRKGSLPALDWPRAERGAVRFVPRNLLARAIVLGLLAVVLLVPVALGIVALLDILPMTRTGFLAFNLVYGAAVGAVMARFVVPPALADRVARTAPAFS